VTKENAGTLAVVQARTSSVRFPNKVLQKVNNRPIIEWQIMRVLQVKEVNRVVLATSEETPDDALEEIASNCGILSVRGSLNNVFSRFLKCLDDFSPKVLVRITGDCPLFMPEICEEMLQDYSNEPIDYLSNTIPPTYPDGCDIEIVSSNALRRLSRLDMTELEAEHVTLGIYTRSDHFTRRNFQNRNDESEHRWTLDTVEDLKFVKDIYAEFKGKELDFTYSDVMSFLKKNPNVARYDNGSMRNQGLRHVE